MQSKSIEELQSQLENVKLRKKHLEEEITRQKREAHNRNNKDLALKKYTLATMITDILGEEVLNDIGRESFREFIILQKNEIESFINCSHGC